MDECVQLETTCAGSNGSAGHEFLLLNSFGYESGQYTSTTGANASAPARNGSVSLFRPRRKTTTSAAATTSTFEIFVAVATLSAQPASESRIGVSRGESSSAAPAVTSSVDSGSS